MKYSKVIDDIVMLEIDDNNLATVSSFQTDGSIELQVEQQLERDEEVPKIIKEFEDSSGNMMHDEDAIFTKYPSLHCFRP